MLSKRTGLFFLAMLGWGCGGGDDVASAGAPAPEAPAAEVGGDQATVDSQELDSIQRANEMLLSRESFSYGGGNRDPFSSLLNLASAGPQFQDLELVGVYMDPDRPGNSVALLRERNTGQPYNLRVGDEIGRARLAQIRRTDIVFTIEDFGFERQETLVLPKREEGTP